MEKKKRCAMKILFVCSANIDRSPTAEKVIREAYAGIETKSAGTSRGAKVHVNEELLQWADAIFCMEYWHKQVIQNEYPELTSNKEIHYLGILDDYSYMESYLVDEIKEKFNKWLHKYQPDKKYDHGNNDNRLEEKT